MLYLVMVIILFVLCSCSCYCNSAILHIVVVHFAVITIITKSHGCQVLTIKNAGEMGVAVWKSLGSGNETDTITADSY